MRVAVIGAGSVSREFATRHFGRPTGTLVTSVVDCDEDRARSLASDVGSVQAGAALTGDIGYRSRASRTLGSAVPHFTELTNAALENCDLVYIGTPPAWHSPFVLQALAAGKHVVLEKPIASTAADADAIVKAAEEAASRQGLETSLNIGMRWNKALWRMRAELEDGRIGTLKDVRLRLHFRTWPREWQVQPWCAGRAEGGPLREVGTHFLFAIHELFGHGCVKRARADVVYPDGPDGSLAESSVDATLELPAGIFGNPDPTMIYLSVRTEGQRSLVAAGQDLYELEVAGTEGGLRLFDFTSLADASGRVLVRNAAYGRRECVEELLNVVAPGPGGAPPETNTLVSAREARNAQRVLDAILTSNNEWTAVEYD